MNRAKNDTVLLAIGYENNLFKATIIEKRSVIRRHQKDKIISSNCTTRRDFFTHDHYIHLHSALWLIKFSAMADVLACLAHKFFTVFRNLFSPWVWGA